MDMKSERTALLPKSVFGECEPGDTLTLKVTRVLDDEIEVAKAEKAYEDEEIKETEMDASMADMDAEMMG